MNKECPLRLPLPRCTYDEEEDELVVDQSIYLKSSNAGIIYLPCKINFFRGEIPFQYQMGPTLSRKEGKNQLWWPKPSAGRTPPRPNLPATALPPHLVDKRGTGFPEHASEEEVRPWDLPEIRTFTRNWRGESSPRSPSRPPTALSRPLCSCSRGYERAGKRGDVRMTSAMVGVPQKGTIVQSSSVNVVVTREYGYKKFLRTSCHVCMPRGREGRQSEGGGSVALPFLPSSSSLSPSGTALVF